MFVTASILLSLLLLLPAGLCRQEGPDLVLDYATAERLAALPLACYTQQYPHKYGLTFNSSGELRPPSEVHPVFHGCFDWHSAVHGHWLMAAVLNRFPGTDLANRVVAVFDAQFQDAKVAGELAVFSGTLNKDFERTYGWAWLLKLQQELLNSPLDGQKGWSRTLKPLVDKVVQSYKSFLPVLVYPVRSGEHTNLAFGLAFAFEYAQGVNDAELSTLIAFNTSGHFGQDVACPLSYEPSGSDFLSPCLQEADLMSRVAHAPPAAADDFKIWLRSLLPQLFDDRFHLQPGHVIDRTDGKLVHLDGLNFSRAWNLYSLVSHMTLPEEEADRLRLMDQADEHVRASMAYVVGSDYAGAHWLATFLVYALQLREEAVKSLGIKA